MNKESANELAEFVNSLSNNISALQALKINAPVSDVIISQTVSQKLEPTTRKAWKLKLNDTPFLLFREFLLFLENRRRALQTLDPPKARGQLKNEATQEKNKRKSNIHHNSNTFTSTSSIMHCYRITLHSSRWHKY
jgi:hypothetical protein